MGPVLIAFAALDFKSQRIKSVASILGATSMGVYLIHPLFTRAISVGLTRCIPAPYTAPVVLSEWSVAWLLSFVAVILIVHIPVARRFV